jgi:hypothetical protein
MELCTIFIDVVVCTTRQVEKVTTKVPCFFIQRFDYYGKRKRNRNRESRGALFRNISDYAEFLFQVHLFISFHNYVMTSNHFESNLC